MKPDLQTEGDMMQLKIRQEVVWEIPPRRTFMCFFLIHNRSLKDRRRRKHVTLFCLFHCNTAYDQQERPYWWL